MKTILFVDDDRINIKLGTAILQSQYQVDVAENGTQALEYLAHTVPDLILLDLHMPDMTGFEVIRTMKQSLRLMHVPVIMLTADEDEESEVEGFHLGVMDFITKPMVAAILLERVKRVIDLDSMQKLLSTDSLTGLNLRTVGESEIEKAMSTEPGFLCFIDVDNLKRINDTAGHEVGDRLLKFMGEILMEQLDHALACRLGGDEFLVYISNPSKEEVLSKVESMINTFLQKKGAEPLMRAASISVGVVATSPTDTYKECYAKADKALYHVKQNGKDGYFLYKEKNDEEELHSDVDLTRLRDALKNSGSYRGAMNVEYREFARLYEYFLNLKRRYNHNFHLAMITLCSEGNVPMNVDTLEPAMDAMEKAIRETVRSVDVCTRYSSEQFLVILMDPGDDAQVLQIIGRIVESFKKAYTNDTILVSVSNATLE